MYSIHKSNKRAITITISNGEDFPFPFSVDLLINATQIFLLCRSGFVEVGEGCKHSEVDQTSALVYESRGFLGQTPISSNKMLFKIDYFS